MLIQDIWTPAVGEALLLKREPEYCKDKHAVASLVPRPPPFFVLRFASSIIHRSGRAQKTGRPGNTYHVNDVRWTRGGCSRVGHCPISSTGAINLRVSFLPVKRDLVNVWSLAWR